MDMANKSILRKQLRQQRKALSKSQQYHAAEAIKLFIANSHFFKQAHHIAFYLCNDSEIDPEPLRVLAEYRSKFAYLPVLHPSNKILYFARYRTGENLQPNKYGIDEPIATPNTTLAPENLDVAFLPLVGFTRQGRRLGMGGGYYDRTFAFCVQNDLEKKPLLIGLAHHFQEIESLPADSWDVNLDAVITCQEIIYISSRITTHP